MKRLLSISLIFSFILSVIPYQYNVLAAKEQVIINETFDDYATNSIPNGITLSGGRCKVVETSSKDKALAVDLSSGKVTYRQEAVNFGDTFVYGVGINYSGEAPSLTIGLNSKLSNDPSSDAVSLSIRDGAIYTANNKLVGGLRPYSENNIKIVVTKKRLMDVYFNGICVLDRWKIYIEPTSGAISISAEKTNTMLYIDNVIMHTGNGNDLKFPIKTYNPTINDDIDLGPHSVFGDYTYFNSDECKINNTSKTVTYEGLTVGSKNNVVLNRLIDYQSPDRQDHIYMDNYKEPGEDCYFDISMTTPSYDQWTPKKYSYFLIEGNFMKEEFGARDTLFWIRDASGSTQYNYQLFHIIGEGKARTLDGRELNVDIKKGKWFNYKLTLDLVNYTADVYINDELVADDILLGDKNISELTMVRCIINKNTGRSNLYLKNFKVTGLANPYQQTSTYRTGIFSDELTEREYLKDKVAMHVYGKQVFANGKKSLLYPEPIYDANKDELYVGANDISEAFNIPEGHLSVEDGYIIHGDNKIVPKNGFKTTTGGELLIPVKEFAEIALRKNIFAHEAGLIIFSDQKLFIDDSEWMYYSFRESTNRGVYNSIDFLNNFMTYERPDKEQILRDFKEKTGDFTEHPRVMANKDDFDRLRNLYKTDARYRSYVDKYIEIADTYLDEDVCVYRFDDAMRALTVAKRIVSRMRAWGFAYQMTGDQKYVDRAWLEFQAAATFPDYNTAHIIDTGEFVHAFGLGYDWMYEGFTEEQREYILNTFYDEAFMELAVGLYGGITAKSGGSNRYIAFIWPSNYNSSVNGGVMTAALAFMEKDPDFCAQVISDSLKSIENTLQLLMPGGAWIESISYWEYAMQYTSVLMGCCDAALGSTYGLERSQGFKETLDYAIGCCGLEGTIGFGDGATTQDYSYDCESYLASKLNHDGAAAMRAYTLEEKVGNADIYTLLYYDADIFSNYKEVLENWEKTLRIDGIEMFTVRNTYDTETENGLYFGTHFGPRQHYHCNNDEGTFVLDMMGERWAEELGSDNYNLQNEMGYSATQLYRYRTEGQNTFTFNNTSGYNQTGGSFYPIERSEDNEYSAYVVSDLSGLYADVPKMKMGYYVGDNMQTVTMRAEMTANKDAESYWFMHTKAEILIEDGVAYLMKNGKVVRVEFEIEGAEAEIMEMEAKPLANSPVVPQQNENKDYRKVAIKFNLKKDVPSSLVVRILPAHIPDCKDNGSLEEWKLQDKSTTYKSEKINVSVLCDGKEVSGQVVPAKNGVLPKLEIIPEDPKAIVEVDYAENVNEKTIIRVWDAQKKNFTMTTVSYEVSYEADINLFDNIPIVGVEVSEEPEPDNHKANMLDNNMQTRWTGMRKGVTATVDLGSIQSVDGVALAFWKGDQRRYFFNIEVSKDGLNWEKVVKNASSSGEVEQLEAFAFPQAYDARFIRFVGAGNDVNGASNVNSNILEFRVLKSKF